MNEQTKKPWVGKLYHAKREEYNNWGDIKDESENLILCVMVPPDQYNLETLNEHRLNNTDPTQERVGAILALLNRED